MSIGWVFIIIGIVLAFLVSPIVGLILVLIGLALLFATPGNIGRW